MAVFRALFAVETAKSAKNRLKPVKWRYILAKIFEIS
jgi:hypothetical protein